MTDQLPGDHLPASGAETSFESSGGSAAETRPIPGQTFSGTIIGPYHLLHLIGEGGMGEVWLAEQKHPIRRRVALKLIKVGMDTKEVVARFESERQALALMDHPAIAKVFDAGSTPEGRPYFVMEYVAGQPITSYCDRHKLSMRQRLELFIPVCEGVQHAHQKAIIHRDLKPSNILVTEVDGKPAPRIIDFGIAKATSQRLNPDDPYTRIGALIGTLGYMSPEQADSAGVDIDTRSDVYSLGVVLYELLSGSLPFDFKKLAYDEMLRCLRENDAPSPSTRLRILGGGTAQLARNRGADPPTLAGQLQGDPDAITLKALEKDRSRRYATPLDMAADIGRYLRNEPVTAHVPSAAYRARKYIRRHRIGVSLIASLVLLFIAFVIAQAVQLQRIRRERDRADRITDFMTSIFKVSAPSEARGKTITAREILDKSSNEIEAGLHQDAEVRSQLMHVMAKTYENLGLYTRAHGLAQHNYDDRLRTLGPGSRATLESMTQLGFILYRQGQNAEAEKFIRQTIDQETRALGAEDPLTLETRDNLAIVLDQQAHYAEQEKISRDVAAIKTRKFGADDIQTLRSRNLLAEAIAGQSRFTDAEQQYVSILEAERRRLGPDHPFTLATMHNMANMFSDEGNYTQAEKLYRETLAIEQRILGPEHPETISTRATIANTIRHDSARYAEAAALYRDILSTELRLLGAEHPSTLETQQGLANVLSSEHHYAEAEQLHRDILATRLRTLGPDNTDTLLSQYNLAETLELAGQHAQAEAILRQTLATQQRVLDANDPDTLASKSLLASVLNKLGRYPEAIPLARDAFDAQLRMLGPGHRDTLSSLNVLGTALARAGRFSDASLAYTAVIGQLTVSTGSSTHSAIPGLWYDLACIAATSGHRDQAFAALDKAVAAGLTDDANLRTDDDLKSLRNDPGFSRLLARVRAAHS